MPDWVVVMDGTQEYLLLTPEEAARSKRRYETLDIGTKEILEKRFADLELETLVGKVCL